MRNYFSLLVPVLAVAALLVGCGGDSKTVKIPGGGEVSVSDKLPDSFPKDFPIYKDAKFVTSIKSKEKGIEGFAASWETKDSADKVKEFYSKEFDKGPWTSSGTFEGGDVGSYSFSNKDGSKEGSLIITTGDGKTQITVFVGDATQASSDSSSSDSSSSDSSKTSTSKKTATAEAESEDSSSSDSSSDKSPTSAKLPDEAKLAKDFPSDSVPLPSGARVTSSVSFGDATGKTFIVELYVKDTPEKVADYFNTELPKRGWTESFTSESDGTYSASYGGDKGSLIISVEQSDTSGYAKVTLSVTAAVE
jgi:hypothetical protein